MKTKLVTQLQSLGLAPKDIEYLSLSPIHPDHSGNANKFSGATFILNKLEHQYMFREDIFAMFGAGYLKLAQSPIVLFTEEYDVFKDSSILIKSMPGHTPGSSVLLVRLEKAGNLLLTGDLYIHAKGRQLNTMLIHNADKEVILTSRQLFEAFAKSENARVIIQHQNKILIHCLYFLSTYSSPKPLVRLWNFQRLTYLAIRFSLLSKCKYFDCHLELFARP